MRSILKSAFSRTWQTLERKVNELGPPTIGLDFNGVMALGSGVINRFPRTHRAISLTFDDGPHPRSTPLILECLQAHEVRATFYCLGARVLAYPDVVQLIVDAGHDIGNHTMTHPSFHRTTPGRQRREIAACSALLRPFLLAPVDQLRAPYGHVRWDTRFIASSLNIPHLVGWDVTPPWDCREPVEISRIIEEQVTPGSIVLLHDAIDKADDAFCETIAAAAAKALDATIPRLKARGLSFATVAEQIRTHTSAASPVNVQEKRTWDGPGPSR
jgi:peptidoglycan-N-acetylglucosamine deacetylase